MAWAQRISDFIGAGQRPMSCAHVHIAVSDTSMSFVTATKSCRDPGSNRGPSDLRSDALPTELSGLLIVHNSKRHAYNEKAKQIATPPPFPPTQHP